MFCRTIGCNSLSSPFEITYSMNCGNAIATMTDLVCMDCAIGYMGRTGLMDVAVKRLEQQWRDSLSVAKEIARGMEQYG